MNHSEQTAVLERRLWSLALLVLVLDAVTTVYGLQVGLQESNPLASVLLEQYGYLAFAVLKGVTLVVAVAGWVVMPRRYRFVIPGCVAGPWAAGSLANAVMILSVLSS